MRILLGGIPLGCDNIGDEAIIACVVKMLKESLPDAELTVATADPNTAERLGVGTVPPFGFAGTPLDGFADVDEGFILKGMKLIITEGKLLCEPSSGIGAGAILQGLVPVKETDKVCLFVSGGSVSLEQIASLEDVEIERHHSCCTPRNGPSVTGGRTSMMRG